MSLIREAHALVALSVACIAVSGHAQGVPATVIPTVASQAPIATPALDRVVTLHIDRLSLRDALTAIAAAGGIDLAFAREEVPEISVSLVSDHITVGSALKTVLEGTKLGILVLSSGRIALGPRAGTVDRIQAQQVAGAIAGHVTDGALNTPLSGVLVRAEGTVLRTTANADGGYAITGVAPGTYHVTARRVGYLALTKDVTVAGGQRATLDFALVAAPTKLDEIVTTAIGQQRRYEVGNTISTINADSITPTAPITSLTDLISARAPGVEVLETSGMTGAGEAIRIRGLSSLVLQNDPILIVDGVRQDNSAGGDIAAIMLTASGATHPTPTRLNDIDFADVASIDILKGPAASTEYGTDAANGVIVITTKHGTAGRPQWRASAEQTASAIPDAFSDGYYSWGHLTDGTAAVVECPLRSGSAYLGLGHAVTAGTCAVDSVTRWNPLNHSATSIFGTGNRGKYDLSVSGGSDAVRYFIAGGLSNETGTIRMPGVFRELADSVALGLPSAALNPNSEQQRSVRVNTVVKLGPTADLAATASYLSTYQQTPNAAQLYMGVIDAPALTGAAHYYGYGYYTGSVASNTPLAQLTALGSDNTERVTGGVTGSWRPTGWFVGHATFGLDHGSARNEEINYPLADPAFEINGGIPNYSSFLGLADATTDVYSADIRASLTVAPVRAVRAVTSGGLQMVDTRVLGQSASTPNVTPTNLTLNGATGATVAQVANRQATLGGYGEEEVIVGDRLFLTAALRIDAASGFGSGYRTAAYPKASASWLVLDRAATTVRVRGAFGESGVQPTNGAALQLYAPSVATIGTGGSALNASTVTWPGNPLLQPERSSEFEGGVDVSSWGNRVSVEMTGYSKTTHDALVNVNLGETFGGLTYQENIGSVRNDGIEASATVGLFQNPVVSWDVTINGSVNHNTLLALAPGVSAQTGYSGPYSQYRQAVGYPLYGIWAQDVRYADANGDGIIQLNEVSLADSATYGGPSLPTREAFVSTHLGLLRGSLTVSGLVDYRGGYRIANTVAVYSDFIGKTMAANDPDAPLWMQARAAENSSFNFNALDVEDGSFVRVREVAVTYAVPRSLLRALKAQTVSLTAAVRNLALWTRYTGTDPEVSNAVSDNVQGNPGAATAAVNNDVRSDGGAVPLARYWVLRLNIGI